MSGQVVLLYFANISFIVSSFWRENVSVLLFVLQAAKVVKVKAEKTWVCKLCLLPLHCILAALEKICCLICVNLTNSDLLKKMFVDKWMNEPKTAKIKIISDLKWVKWPLNLCFCSDLKIKKKKFLGMCVERTFCCASEFTFLLKSGQAYSGRS